MCVCVCVCVCVFVCVCVCVNKKSTHFLASARLLRRPTAVVATVCSFDFINVNKHDSNLLLNRKTYSK